MPTNTKHEQWIKCNTNFNEVEGQCLIGKTFFKFFYYTQTRINTLIIFLHNISKEKKKSSG